MGCRLYCLIVLASLCSGAGVHSQEQPPFSRHVVGYVKDRAGHPVQEAEVCGQPHSAWAGPIPCGVSKADGGFTLNFWRPGTYTISAEKKSAGYPNAGYGFYGRFFGEYPTVTVDEASELPPVEVIVGPKTGRVIFKIVDDESGQPVDSGLLDVCRTDNPKMCWEMSTAFPKGRYELLAPDVPFTVKFKVWGGRHEWEEREAVVEGGAPVRLLHVGSGEEKELNIRLRQIRK